ncbi:hypothetical protein IWW55_002899 [Coemansia sp. RSA 2706]|nr:hypothetical protein IWW55_002899 [Coemansia sp. RSA 2706]
MYIRWAQRLRPQLARHVRRTSTHSSSIAMLGSDVPWETAALKEPKRCAGRTATRHRALAAHLPTEPEEPRGEPSFYSEDVDRFACIDQQPVTLQRLLETCQPPLTRQRLLENAQFLCHERPVRYARRVQLLAGLPYIVNLNPHINAVYQAYYANFEEARRFPMVESLADERRFVHMLARQSQSLKHIMPQIARGFFECRRYFGPEPRRRFLDQLVKMRIGLRLLTSQHIALYDQFQAANAAVTAVAAAEDADRYQGIVDNHLRLADMVRVCAQGVQATCEMTYGDAPDFSIDGQLDVAFCYIPSHLDYMLTELLKNAFRASLARAEAAASSSSNSSSVPPVAITVSKSDSRVAIRIRDCGGGIPSHIHDRVFDYAFTTSEHHDSPDGSAPTPADPSAISGLGFGLPMTKIYAEYFGGSLNLISLEGYGCDAFLELPSIKLNRTPEIQI